MASRVKLTKDGKRVAMRKGGGKAKGASFERWVCKELSLWLSHGAADDWFWRSAMSGGRATVKAKAGGKNYTQVGDLSAVAEDGIPFLDHFVVECKHVRDLNWESALFRQTGALLQFWETLCRIADDSRRMPLLIARQNNCPVVMITSQQGAETLTSQTPLVTLTVTKPGRACSPMVVYLMDSVTRLRLATYRAKRLRQ